MLTDAQVLNLKTNIVNKDLLMKNGLNFDYYIQPLVFIEDKLKIKLQCTGLEYKEAVEIANDEDIAPPNSSMDVIVDGVLAYVFHDYLESVGLDLVTYFSYRFNPGKDFLLKLGEFERLVNLHKRNV